MSKEDIVEKINDFRDRIRDFVGKCEEVNAAYKGNVSHHMDDILEKVGDFGAEVKDRFMENPRKHLQRAVLASIIVLSTAGGMTWVNNMEAKEKEKTEWATDPAKAYIKAVVEKRENLEKRVKKEISEQIAREKKARGEEEKPFDDFRKFVNGVVRAETTKVVFSSNKHNQDIY